MKPLILLAGLLVLAGCASPRQNCLKSATRDLAVVDGLIAETQANLARGYGVEREPYTSNQINMCLGSGGYGYYRGGVGFNYCTTPSIRYRNTPVAIDQVAEQRKLQELKATRARVQKDTQQRLAQCNLLFPPG